MNNSQARQILEKLEDELRRNNMDDIHLKAYNYANIERTERLEFFLENYLSQLINLFKTYSSETIESSIRKINRVISNRKEMKLTTISLEFEEFQEVQTFDLSKSTNYNGLISLAQDILNRLERDRNRGFNRGL